MKAMVNPVFLLLLLSGTAKAGVVTTTSPSDYGKHNGSVSLSIAGGIAPYTISWSGPGGFTDTAARINDLAPGIYCAQVTDHYCGQLSVCVTVTELPATGITDPLASDIQLYPNPFDRTLHLSFKTATQGDALLELHDMNGRMIQSQAIHLQASGSYTLQLQASLPPGVYVITALSAKGELLLRRQVLCQPKD